MAAKLHDRALVLKRLGSWLETGLLTRTSHGGMWSYNSSSRCDRPVHRTMDSKAAPVWAKSITNPKGDARSIFVDLELRCRKCAPCLRSRAATWRHRGYAEIATAKRTWFITLTLSPDEHVRALARATLRCSASGYDFSTLSESEQFAARHQAIGPEITQWMKRVRKNTQAKLRYLLVVEAHDSKLPHYHMLLHEVGDVQARKADIQSAWKLGFSNCKLVPDGEPKAAAYVCKYLAKSSLARVRASLRYGDHYGITPSKVGHGHSQF